ncbi:MAG TPA: RlpA-like double-psi beta-barrel domain-containing protein [Acetobacteraceae bacterium]|nr:RlpA-like double-psi beta-barrel domain-containing protein [Acetobacteraceae bacterium]
MGLALLASAALAGCNFRRERHGPAPTGAHYLIGEPFQAGGEWHYPRAFNEYDGTGLATVIPPGHEAATADGEAFHQGGLMAQSPVLPLPSLVRIANLVNGRALTVRVNDRGPAVPGRIVAVTRKVASLLGFPPDGVVEVRVELLAARSAALQAELGEGPHLTAAPVASVQSAALPPPPGASGDAGASPTAAPSQPAAIRMPAESTALSGIIHQSAPAPGPLYVEMGGFGTARDAWSLRDRLPDMTGSVVPEAASSRTLYAVRLGPYHSVAAADAALRSVLARGIVDPEIVVR